MSIRLDVQLDYESESTRYVASATLDGEFLHEVGKYGGPEVCGVVERSSAPGARPGVLVQIGLSER